MVRGCFTNLYIGLAGNFGENWSKSRMNTFIQNNGGTAVGGDDDNMTHLICTEKAYEAKVFAVQFAQRHDVKIVTFDWFEDSLHAHSKKREKPFLLATVIREKRKARKRKAKERTAAVDKDMTNFSQIVREAKATYNLAGHAMYFDPTGFEYNISLTRLDSKGNKHEKVILRMYETFEPPFQYAVFSTYISPTGNEARTVLAPAGSDHINALEAFQVHFKQRTGKEWKDRANADLALMSDGSKDVRWFVYCQPERGPLGMDLPPGRDYANLSASEDSEEMAGDKEGPDYERVAFRDGDGSEHEGFVTADEGDVDDSAQYKNRVPAGMASRDSNGGFDHETAQLNFNTTPKMKSTAQRGMEFFSTGSPAFPFQTRDFTHVGVGDVVGKTTYINDPYGFIHSKALHEGNDDAAMDVDKPDVKSGIVTWNWGRGNS